MTSQMAMFTKVTGKKIRWMDQGRGNLQMVLYTLETGQNVREMDWVRGNFQMALSIF